MNRQKLTVTFAFTAEVRQGLARHLGRHGDTATLPELEETIRTVVADVFEQLVATPHLEKKKLVIKRKP